MNLLELPFFSGFTVQELRRLRDLGCMRLDRFQQGTVILQAGSRTHEMGIVVSGRVHIESNDLWGIRSILSLLPLLDPKNSRESWHARLMQRMLRLSTQKNLTLSTRIFCTSAKNVRGRLLTYLSGEAARQGKTEFDIPFNRQQLADYLNLDRSALSKELSRMRDEGMLEYRRNHFKLNKNET